ncbi:MAG: isocitrate lyase/phosphoenolpyruvate mutase family protein [Lewinella sp.]
MNFHELHHQPQPLILGNVWDVPSAISAEETGFKALGTSSAAMAKMLGYPDGEKIPFTHVRLLTSRILAHVAVPVSVDLEAGYSRDPAVITRHICDLAELGIVGINLEDSVVTDGRKLQVPEAFADLVAAVKAMIPPSVFLNIRTDTFLMGHPDKLTETIRRIQLYEDAGADGVFVPGLVAPEDIVAVVGNTLLPLNLMCFPGLPTFTELAQLGVARISMGNFLHENQQADLRQHLSQVISDQSFQSVC